MNDEASVRAESAATAGNGLRVAYVPGVTPGKWLDRWNDRLETPLRARLHDAGDPLDLLRLPEDDPEYADMVFVRFPEGESPANPELHVIPLYVEQPVVCAAREHLVEAYDDEVPYADLSDEPFLDLRDYPPAVGGAAMAIEVVATGAALAVLPMSVARLYHRKDVVYRVLTGAPEDVARPTQVGLAWPRLDPRDPELEAALADPESSEARRAALIEEFVGIVRGRRAESSRQPSVRERQQAEAAKAQKKRQSADKAGNGKSGGGQSGAGRGKAVGSGAGKGGNAKSGGSGKGSAGKGGSGRGGAKKTGAAPAKRRGRR